MNVFDPLYGNLFGLKKRISYFFFFFFIRRHNVEYGIQNMKEKKDRNKKKKEDLNLYSFVNLIFFILLFFITLISYELSLCWIKKLSFFINHVYMPCERLQITFLFKNSHLLLIIYITCFTELFFFNKKNLINKF